MSADPSLRAAKRRLEKLQGLCIPESEHDREARLAREDAEAKRLNDMSPLEKFVYLTTKEVNDLQQKQIEYNDKIGTNPSWTNSRDAVLMRNQMNKIKMGLRKKYEKIPPPKNEEEKKNRESLKRMLEKVKRADRAASGLRGSGVGAAGGSDLYSDLSDPLTGRGGGGGGASGDSPQNSGRRSGVQEWDGESDIPGSGYEPVTLGQEFQDLMQVFRRNDEQIEQLLENIAHGVISLHEQAKNISVELKTQDVLITEATQKTENIHSKLVGVNKKLKKTIEAINKDKLCLYVICLLVLLALAGVLLVVTKVVKT